MKKHLLLLIALLGFVCPAFAQTPSPAPVPALPKIITDGFDAYQKTGAASAVDAWFTGSPMLNNASNKTGFVTYLTTEETNCGKYSGYDYIGSITMSPSVKYYYFVFLYGNGFFYDWFEVYTTGGKDVITSYSGNSVAASILPASFFIKDKNKPAAPTTP